VEFWYFALLKLVQSLFFYINNAIAQQNNARAAIKKIAASKPIDGLLAANLRGDVR
jgi:hypothetical protein